MRAAIYGRVSSERQEKEHTIGSQLEALRAYAAKNGMEVVEEFTDEGYSGARLDRPALDRMRDLAERRGFEVLLSYCTDRLARKFVLQALILDELERFGVKTVFLEGGAADDPLSKLMHQITGAVAEFERAKITERYRRGKLYRARCGEIVSPDVPFGYVKIPRRDGVPAHAEIHEAEAVVVRRIFDAYVSRDLTVRQIAKQLTLERTPTPRNGGGQWSWSGVDRILHEEAYIGTYYYNRKQCVPIEGVYGKKRQRFKCTLRPKEEWIPISVPPIIDWRRSMRRPVGLERTMHFLHGTCKKAVTCCASLSAVADADAVARHSPANKPMVASFTPATTMVACAPPAAFSSRSDVHNGVSVPMCWTNWCGKK
jgi:site-specific DNA recombinase